MKVLPFYLKQKHKQNSLSITNLTVFLSNGGKTIWQTEEATLSVKQLEEDYLQPNGLVAERIIQTPNVIYVEINPVKTRLQDFYTWDEALQLPSRVECWRSYYFFKDETGADWFTGKQLQESELEGKSIHEYYEEIGNLCSKNKVAS